MRTVIWNLRKANRRSRRNMCQKIANVVGTGALYQLTKTNNLMADPNGHRSRLKAVDRAWRSRKRKRHCRRVIAVGSYTYTDAEYTTDTTGRQYACTGAQNTRLRGLTIPSLTVRFRSDAGHRWSPYWLQLYGDPLTQRGYTVGSVSALARRHGGNAALHVNNLFDRNTSPAALIYGCLGANAGRCNRILPFLIFLGHGFCPFHVGCYAGLHESFRYHFALARNEP